MKGNREVIAEFNEYVNMTVSELEEWLQSDASNKAGMPKDGGDGGKSVGQESGTKIVDILKSNPHKDADKYTDEHLEHMRKVVSYCKRHLAQEAGGNKEKDPEDVKQTKSYISLKNWGHDFLKGEGNRGNASTKEEQEADEDVEMENLSKEDTQNGEEKQEVAETKTDEQNTKTGNQNGKHNGKQDGDDHVQEQEVEDGGNEEAGKVSKEPGKSPDKHNANGRHKNGEDNQEEEAKDTDGENKENGNQDGQQNDDDDAREEQEKEDKEEQGNKDKRAGEKRKSSRGQNGSNKKRDITKKSSAAREESGDENGAEDDEDKNQASQDDADEGSEDGASGEKSSKKGPKKGQTVSWKWGNGNPEGKVLDVKEDKYVCRGMTGGISSSIQVFIWLTSRQGDHYDEAWQQSLSRR